MKALESYTNSNFDSDTKKGNPIIDVETNVTIVTIIVQPNELEELEEGKHLF